MIRKLCVALGIAVALVACDRAAKLDKAYEAAEKVYDEAENPQEKVAIMREFLASYPESEHTLGSVRRVVRHLSRELEQAVEADSFVIEVLGKVKDDELRRDLMKTRIGLLGKLGRGADLVALAQEIAALKPLDIGENERLIDAGTECGEWQLVLDHSEAAIPQCTPEQIREDFPGREMSDDDVAHRVANRLASALAAKGWALANLQRPDEALATFDEAEGHDPGSFTGDPDSQVGSYRGRTLARLGRHEEAMEALAPYAIFGHDEEALEVLRESYSAMRESEEGFDEYLWETRLKLAPHVVDFSLADYDGSSHSFSDLSNGKITLLSFWFPT